MKTAIVFKGGLARGFGAIGLIRFLEERNLEPTLTIGASTGSQIAAMYGLQIPWQEMIEITSNFRLAQTSSFRNLLLRGHLFSNEKIKEWFISHIPSNNVKIEELNRKIALIVANKNTKQQELFSNGSLLNLMLASSAFPRIIESQTINGVSYSDGDLPGRFLIDRIKQEGIEKVIGISYQKGTSGLFAKIAVNSLLNRSLHKKSTKDEQRLDLHLQYQTSIGFTEFPGIPAVAEDVYKICITHEKQLLSFLR